MATLANLTVAINGSTVGLNRSLQQAQTRTDKFRSRAGLAFRAVRTAALGLAVAGGASGGLWRDGRKELSRHG